MTLDKIEETTPVAEHYNTVAGNSHSYIGLNSRAQKAYDWLPRSRAMPWLSSTNAHISYKFFTLLAANAVLLPPDKNC